MAALRKLINEHCKECVYDKSSEGNWRQQVEACQGKTCKLYSVRPTSTSLKASLGDIEAVAL
jgi:hypothetical protein